MSIVPCCPDIYYCPTSGDDECPRHGGFDVCCGRPDLHSAVQPQPETETP